MPPKHYPFLRDRLHPLSDYMGERTAAGLVKEATRSMPSYNKRIKTEGELQQLISKVSGVAFAQATNL